MRVVYHEQGVHAARTRCRIARIGRALVGKFLSDVEAGKVGFGDLSKYMLAKGEPDENESGRVEMLENILNEYL